MKLVPSILKTSVIFFRNRVKIELSDGGYDDEQSGVLSDNEG